MVIGDGTGHALRNGRPLVLENTASMPQSSAGSRCRVYTRDGQFLGVVRFDPERGEWQPEKVFAQ